MSPGRRRPSSTGNYREELPDSLCEEFLFRDQKWAMLVQNIVYTIDQETGIPLRVESYAPGREIRRDNPFWRWSTSEFGRMEGHYLPVESQSITYGMPGTPRQGKEAVRLHFRVDTVRYGGSYPRSMFWPETRQTDVLFIDTIAKKVEYPRANPKATHRLTPETGVAQPIRADNPADSAATISNVMMGLGLAAIIVGGFLRLRRR